MTDFSQKWRLDSLLKNSDSFFEACKKDIALFLENPTSIDAFQDLSCRCRQHGSYAACLFSENVESPEGLKALAQAQELNLLLNKASLSFDQKLAQDEVHITDSHLDFIVSHKKATASEKMDLKTEALVEDLSLRGYHSWSELYKKQISKMLVPVGDKVFSCSQIDNLLSDPSREVRKSAFLALENECQKEEGIFSECIRAIYGFRKDLYRHRNWKNHFHESLRTNYLEQSTIDTMWKAVDAAAPAFHTFLDEKAKAFGLKKLSWYDFEAPYPGSEKEISFNEGCEIILDALSGKWDEVATFTRMCLERGWVEAENRPKKAPGGFCTPFPLSKESRIYMSYSGSWNNVLVLAHEIGHAYHNHVSFELPELLQHYPMSLAEAASTTLELIVLDHMANAAKTRHDRKRFFYEKAHRSTTFFLNIRARYLFEDALFNAGGYIDAEKLCEMMVDAQKTAYGNRLDVYHPYFWITKQHFYLTEYPSYNFPYTFGYLISQSLRSRFNGSYKAFLQDTGCMKAEDLIQKHFGKSAQDDLFWQKACDSALEDIQEFIAL